jgi:uncharacterized membrane protein YccF (DUF307 family)
MGMIATFCRHCGAESEGQFCTSCGRSMGDLPAAQSTARLAPWPAHEPTAHGYPGPQMQNAMAGGQLQPVAVNAPMTSGIPYAPPSIDTTNVHVNVAGPQILYQEKTGSGLFARSMYFVCIGWWLGGVWIMAATFFNSTVIGLPVGIMMFNAVPKVMTLRSRNVEMALKVNADGTYTLTRQHVEQHPFWLRAVYFVFIGCWFSFVWAVAAYALALMIVTLPISFLMFDKMPAVTTLARY